MTERLEDIVVVGAGLAGLRAAQALRKRGYDGRLRLVGDEPHEPYDRPPLSKQVLLGKLDRDKLFFRSKENHAALALEYVLGRSARALDPHARRLSLDDGSELAYDGLVIATGAAPRRLPHTAQLAGVHVLRTLDDSFALRAALLQRPRVAIVGAGFIGLEVAAVCRELGLEVTVIEPQPQPLANVLGELAAGAVQRMHEAHGVVFHCGLGVSAIEGAGRVERLRLSDGSAFAADLALVGIGVSPNTAWLEGSGVALADGVVCDARCATNVPRVVAAGDVARWPNASYDAPLRVEHWSNAVEQGQAAAASLLDGSAAAAYVHLPYFWSDQYDVKLQAAGRARRDDTAVVVDGDLGSSKFVVLYGRAGQLVCVLASNRPAQFLRYRKLVAERASFERACAPLST